MIIDRDGKRCGICSARRELVSHTVSKAAGEHRYSVNNKITLCGPCSVSMRHPTWSYRFSHAGPAENRTDKLERYAEAINKLGWSLAVAMSNYGERMVLSAAPYRSHKPSPLNLCRCCGTLAEGKPKAGSRQVEMRPERSLPLGGLSMFGLEQFPAALARYEGMHAYSGAAADAQSNPQ